MLDKLDAVPHEIVGQHIDNPLLALALVPIIDQNLCLCNEASSPPACGCTVVAERHRQRATLRDVKEALCTRALTRALDLQSGLTQECHLLVLVIE